MLGVDPSELMEKVDSLLPRKDVRRLESKVEELTRAIYKLQNQVRQKEEELERSKKLSTESVETLGWNRDFLGNTGDIVNRAWLFDEGVHKEGAQLGPKLVSISVSYGGKMERTLSEMREVLGLSPPLEIRKGSGWVGGATPSKVHSPSLCLSKREKVQSLSHPGFRPMRGWDQKLERTLRPDPILEVSHSWATVRTHPSAGILVRCSPARPRRSNQ